MKSLLIFLLAFVAIDISAVPSRAVRDANADLLLGEWYYLEPGETGHSTLFFGADGRFKGKYVLNQGIVVSFSGRWSYKEDKIYYQYEWCSHAMSVNEGTDTIIELSEKTLITLEGNGPPRKVYRKISK